MKRFLFVLILISSVASATWWGREPIRDWWESIQEAPGKRKAHPPSPDRARYETLKEEMIRWRKELSGRYQRCRSEEERHAVLGEARTLLESALPEMMRCWLGTPWDFHGTAEFPGEGKIACGYFVSTVLRDAGFQLDRYKLARQPSQNILRTFLPRESLVLRVGVPYERFVAELADAERGIRIVGLDSHVAFLVGTGEGFRFIHSSGSSPWCVVDESAANAPVLRQSNYRVHGLLTADKGVLRRWLMGERFVVKELPHGERSHPVSGACGN